MKYKVEVYLKDTKEWLQLQNVDSVDAEDRIKYLKLVTGRRHRVLNKSGGVVYDTGAS